MSRDIGYAELARVALAKALDSDAEWAALREWVIAGNEHSPALHDYLDAEHALNRSRLHWLAHSPDLGTGGALGEAARRARAELGLPDVDAPSESVELRLGGPEPGLYIDGVRLP